MSIQNNVPNDNVISYDSGDKVFQHDKERGKWSSNWDYFTACIGHSFSVVNFTLLAPVINETGVSFIIIYLLGSLVFTIPIIFIQSFLGQFSSTGFISVFRIAPMFKGIGYVILCLNLVAVSYHAVYTAVPLLYLFSSIRPNLLWMSCTNSWNSETCIEETSNLTITGYPVWATDEFFMNEIILKYNKSYWPISWKLLATTIFIWILLGVVMSTKIKIIGQILRFSTISMIILLLVLFVRLLFLPTSFASILEFLTPKSIVLNRIGNFIALVLTALTFGSGWGTILTLASYNDFKINIGKMSVMICISHLVVIMFCGTIQFMIKNYVDEIYEYRKYDRNLYMNDVYTMLPFLFGKLEVPQLWSVIYFLMLFLGEFSSCIIQILSIVTAIFDEFVKLRVYKNGIKIGLLAFLAVFSIGYTFRNGVYLVIQVMSLSGVSQMFICFIELMIVVWIYGRLRFQRDIKFMTGIQYSTWKFFIVRLVTPIFILISCGFYFVHFVFTVFFFPESNAIWLVLTLFIQFLPILVIPIYMVIRLAATTGTFLNRFRRLCKPTDWYPVDPFHRQKYEEYLGNPDISHQLVDMDELENGENDEL